MYPYFSQKKKITVLLRSMWDYKNKMGCVSIVARWRFSVLHFACVIQEPVESSVICLQGSCQKPCSLFESNNTSSHRSRAEPLDCLKAAESKLSKYQFYTLLHSRRVLSREIPRVLPVESTGHRLWDALIYIIWRFKVQGFFICHIINYTGYNQKWNVDQIRSAQWTVQRIKII